MHRGTHNVPSAPGWPLAPTTRGACRSANIEHRVPGLPTSSVTGADIPRLCGDRAPRQAWLKHRRISAGRDHEWQAPGGGAAGALSHAVIHSLDITIALDRPAVASEQAVVAVLGQLAAANGALFGVDLTGVRLEAADTSWSWGSGPTLRANSGQLVALLSGRTLPEGRALQHVE